MGLKDKLQNDGSALTAFGPNTPSVNVLATKQSPMHDNYSITGDSQNLVNNYYQQYLDGTNNTLPTPSVLDLGGTPPSIAPRYFSTSPTTPQSLPYNNNRPV